MRKSTIKDVAARAQVSLKTVSRVINDEAGVHERTRARVRNAIAELAYQPDPSARSLRSAQSYAIGLLYDNPNPYYVIAMQNGVLSVCRETGYGLQIHPCDATAPTLANEIVQLVANARLAGIVLAPPMSEQQALIETLVANGVRLVRIVSATKDPQDGSACIYVDDRDAAYAITEHLIQLGHQRIGFLWGGKSHGSSWERYNGYAEALADYGITLDGELVVEGDYSFDDGFRGARKLLALPQRPTAILFPDDFSAIGGIQTIREEGLLIPRDISVAGYDGNLISQIMSPQLTTYRQDTEALGRAAAELLIEQIESPRTALPEQKLISGSLLKGQSVDVPNP